MSQNFNGDVTERTLTVTNYGTDDKNEEIIRTRVTIAPHLVQAIVASEDTVQSVDGVSQHRVNVLFMDSNQIELFITALDLVSLERCVGSYFLP